MGILDFWVILEILKIFDNFRGLLKKKRKDILMVTTYFGNVGSFMSFFFFFFFFILWVFQGYFEHFKA